MGTGSTAPAALGGFWKGPHTHHAPLTTLGHLLGSPAVGTAATTPQNTVLRKLSSSWLPPCQESAPHSPQNGTWFWGQAAEHHAKLLALILGKKKDGSSTDNDTGDLGEVRERDRAVTAPGPLPGRGPLPLFLHQEPSRTE